MKIPLPDLDEQQKVIDIMRKEYELVESSKNLITLFEQKIKDKIGKVWGE